jgi:hypothetical protein
VSRHEGIDNSIWADPTFEALTADAKLLYLWSFTNPACNMAGLYRVSTQRMHAETGLSSGKLERALAELRDRALAFYERQWLWVRTRVKYLRSRNPNMAKSIAHDLGRLGADDPLRHRFCDEYGDYPWLSEAISGLVGESRSVEPKPETVSKQDGVVQCTATAIATAPEEQEPQQGEVAEDFERWLEHHQRTTGLEAPRRGTQARANVAVMYRARRAENYAAEDLELAVVGAFNDPYRRENGHYGCESVLRPTKVQDLVAKGKRGKIAPVGKQGIGRQVSDVRPELLHCIDCPKPIDEFRFRNRGRRCESCEEKYDDRVAGAA